MSIYSSKYYDLFKLECSYYPSNKLSCTIFLVLYIFFPDTQVSLSTYLSAPGIVKQISALHSDLMSLQSDLENSLPEDRNRCTNEL